MDYTELVLKAQHGDSAAYGELVRRFQGMAFGYAYSILHDFHLAEDACQEAFIEGYRDVGNLREPTAWSSWLRRVVFKHCHRLFRRKQLPTAPLETAMNVASCESSADERLIDAETKQQVRAALGGLPQDEAAVTILFYLNSYRQRDIAEFLEISLDTVKNRLRSARRKLNERMLKMTEEVLREEAPSVHERFTEVERLYDACERGDVATVTTLLQKYPQVLNGGDYDMTFFYPAHFGRSPLYQAGLNGHLSLVKVLLDMGANPIPHEVSGRYHQDDFTDWTDTIRERGHDEIVEMLDAARRAHYGPLVDDANIHAIVRSGNVEQVRKLIDENPEYVRQVDAVGNTPLHWAVNAGDFEMVRLLVERETPIDARRGDGRTPSLVAIFGFHRYWRREEKPEILEYLLEHGAARTMLIAAATGDVERVRQFIRDDPASVNAIDPCQRRPLSAAAEIGNVEIVKLLLEHGADPNARELMCQGSYALHTAAANSQIQVARLLLEAGANPEHWMDSSGTPIIIAAYRGHSEMMQLLYAYGATTEIQYYAANYRIDVVAEVLKLNPSAANDVLPYQWIKPWDKPELAMDIMRLAIRYGVTFESETWYKLLNTTLAYPNVAGLLFEHGGNPSRPLVHAARGFHGATRNTVAFLVEKFGADVNHREDEGELTPLASAAGNGQRDIVEYLIAKGASVNPPDTPSWATPLYLVQKNGHQDMANLLRQRGATK